MIAYDPALIEWLVYNLRYVAANISYECKACGCSSCADCECALRHAERDRYTRAADQLEAARREVDKVNGYADGWNKRCQELQERNAEDEREFARAMTQLTAERDHWRESRRAAMEAGEILKAERDAARAEVARLKQRVCDQDEELQAHAERAYRDLMLLDAAARRSNV